MNYRGWDIFATHHIDIVADKILTSRKASEFVEDIWAYGLIGTSSTEISILDFGCGIGRNTFGMGIYSSLWTVIGYDNENMIRRTSEYADIKGLKLTEEYPNISFISDWDVIKCKQFDVIFCSLVLQHIHEVELKMYLGDFKKMTTKLIVNGRRFNDDAQKNTWEIIESMGFYPSQCSEKGGYIKDGDPEAHFTCVYDW